jgi:hypothetical protein
VKTIALEISGAAARTRQTEESRIDFNGMVKSSQREKSNANPGHSAGGQQFTPRQSSFALHGNLGSMSHSAQGFFKLSGSPSHRD